MKPLKIWKTIENEVGHFLQSDEQILLISSSQGTGKTISTLKKLQQTGKKFIYLGPNHKFIDNIVQNNQITNQSIFHVYGRNQPGMCENEHLDDLTSCKVDITSIMCDKEFGKCPYRFNCNYKNQIQYILEENPCWAGTHGFLTTQLLRECFEKYNYEVLVIDEHCINSLASITEFNKFHLRFMEKIIKEIIKNTTYHQEIYFGNSLLYTILTLQSILEEASKIKREITGKQFIDLFWKLTTSSPSELKIDVIKNKKGKGAFIREYTQYIQNMFKNNYQPTSFRNILFELIEIIKRCTEYNGKHVETGVFALYGEKTNFIQINQSNLQNLPECKKIILDANAKKQFYQTLLKTNIKQMNPQININRNIIQFIEGKYPKSSLTHQQTRKRIYQLIYQLIQQLVNIHHVKKIFIVTHKPYSTIKNENEKTENQSIERYLKKHSSDIIPSNYEITHFEYMKGINNNELIENGKLIILGTPEPNISELRKKMSAFFVGEKPISINYYRNRNGELHYYDKRLEQFVRYERETKLEHVIERLRFSRGEEHKECILFSKQQISFITKKMDIHQLRKKYQIANLQLKNIPEVKTLKWIQHKKRVTQREYHNNIRSYKKKPHHGFIMSMVQKKEGYLYLTNNAKNYLAHMDKLMITKS